MISGWNCEHLFCQSSLQKWKASGSQHALHVQITQDNGTILETRAAQGNSAIKAPSENTKADQLSKSQPGIWAGYGSARWRSLMLTY